MLDLSIGKVKVAPPALRGWKKILGVLPEAHYRTLVQAALAAPKAQAEGGPEGLRKVGEGLVPLLAAVPDLAAAIVWACVRDEDGKRIPEARAWEATAVDVDSLVDVLVTSDFARDFLARLKKRTAGAAKIRVVGPASPQA